MNTFLSKAASAPLMIGTISMMLATPVFGQPVPAGADRAFMMKASQSNVAEIASGKLAEQKGSSPDIRMLGKHFADNHSTNEKMLGTIAGKLGVSLPMHPTAADQMAMMKLKSLSGAAFDAAYINMEEQGHIKNIAAFKLEAGMTSNTMLATYVKSSIPVLEEHLQIATDDSTRLHHMSGMSAAGISAPASMSSSAPSMPSASTSPMPVMTSGSAAPGTTTNPGSAPNH